MSKKLHCDVSDISGDYHPFEKGDSELFTTYGDEVSEKVQALFAEAAKHNTIDEMMAIASHGIVMAKHKADREGR